MSKSKRFMTVAVCVGACTDEEAERIAAKLEDAACRVAGVTSATVDVDFDLDEEDSE
jgi:hypothetical protein